MGRLQVPYTIRRQGIYFFNLRVGSSLVRVSLKTRERSKALPLAVNLKTHLDQLQASQRLAELKQAASIWLQEEQQGKPQALPSKTQAGSSETPTIEDPTPTNPPQKQQTAGPVLTELFGKYEREMVASGAWRPRTQQIVNQAFSMLLDILGDVPISSVSSESARQVKDELLDYPVRRFMGNSAKKSLAELRAAGVKRIDPHTVKNVLVRIASFFNWLKANRYIEDNYFSGIAPKGFSNIKGNRKPFSRADIQKLFTTERYTHLAYSQPWEYWLPLLGLYTGARLEELCQLQKSDVRKAGDVHYLDIHEGNAKDNTTKNASANRRVPLHSHLIELGFLDYVAARPMGRLFNLKRVNHRLSHYASTRFSDYKTRLGFGVGKTFHSFRHTLRDELVEAEARSEHIKAILGHEQGDMTHGHYGSGFKPQTLSPAIESVSFRKELAGVAKWVV